MEAIEEFCTSNMLLARKDAWIERLDLVKFEKENENTTSVLSGYMRCYKPHVTSN